MRVTDPLSLSTIRDVFSATLRRPMARHAGASFAIKLFSLGCGFLYAVAAARLLGATGYGIVAVVLSIATVMATVALLGINGLAVRETAALSAREDWPTLRRFVQWACVTVLCTSAASAVLVALAAMQPGPFGKALVLGSLAVPLLAALLLLRGMVQGAGNVIAAQVPTDAVRWAVSLPLMGSLLLTAGSVTPRVVIMVVLVALACSLAVSIVLLRRQLRQYAHGPTIRARQHHWLAESLPFLAVAVFGIVGTEISTLLLGWLAGPTEAGLYQPIARLAPLMLLANEAVEMALAPRIVRMWEAGDRHGLERLIQRSAVVSTAATAAIAASILIASPFILAAFGNEFTKYQSMLVWIAIAQVANAALGASALLLAMVGSMKRRMQAQLVTLVVQAALGIALIPAMGAAGAVISLTAAIFTWAAFHWWQARRATGIDTSLFAALRSTAKKE